MDERKDFIAILSDEKFQDGIAHFDSLNSQERAEFIKQYPIIDINKVLL